MEFRGNSMPFLRINTINGGMKRTIFPRGTSARLSNSEFSAIMSKFNYRVRMREESGRRDGEKARRDHGLFRMQLRFASIPSVLADAAYDVCFVCNHRKR